MFNSFHAGNFFPDFVACYFFQNLLLIPNTIRVSNSLDTDQVLCFVGPDPGQNCHHQRRSTDDNADEKTI